MLEHNGRFNSRDYDKIERMELMESPIRYAIHKLKTYSLETLAQRFDVCLFGRGKHVFARLDAEDDLLARKIFLNLEIDQQKTVLFRLKNRFKL